MVLKPAIQTKFGQLHGDPAPLIQKRALPLRAMSKTIAMLTPTALYCELFLLISLAR
jgi:hypothetical protein